MILDQNCFNGLFTVRWLHSIKTISTNVLDDMPLNKLIGEVYLTFNDTKEKKIHSLISMTLFCIINFPLCKTIMNFILTHHMPF